MVAHLNHRCINNNHIRKARKRRRFINQIRIMNHVVIRKEEMDIPQIFPHI
jgi:hypothetical protein